MNGDTATVAAIGLLGSGGLGTLIYLSAKYVAAGEARKVIGSEIASVRDRLGHIERLVEENNKERSNQFAGVSIQLSAIQATLTTMAPLTGIVNAISREQGDHAARLVGAERRLDVVEKGDNKGSRRR